MQSEIQFADERVRKAFEKLKKKDPTLYKFVCRTFKDIEENVFCGVQISKRLIPKEYLKNLK